MLSRTVAAACRHQRRACVQTSSRTLASVAETTSQPSSSTPPPTSPSSSGTPTKRTINAAVVLNRSPILTRTPTPFERAYYAYQSRIQRAIFNPFPTEFYFKPGSLLEKKFAREEKAREREAFGGVWALKRAAAEAEGGASAPDSAENMGEEVLEPPAPRIHAADISGDVKSLDRAGERNLYLLVLAKDIAGKQVWRFPQGGLRGGEFLHQAALRDLHAECGENMDTWIVSKNPIGVHQPTLSETAKTALGEVHTFFYKGHILAGQVRPDGKNVVDFAWLTKEEIESKVESDYWASVKDMLSDF